MYLFICLYLFIFVFANLNMNRSKNDTLYVFVSISMFLIFISSFRFESGLDYFNYKVIFDSLKNIDVSSEILFWSLMITSKSIVDNYHFFVIMISFITVFIQCYFIYKLSKYRIYSLLVFFVTIYITYDIGLQRNALALSLCFISLFFIINNNKIGAFVFYILAILCHTSAVLFIIPILLKRNKNKISIIYLFIPLISFFIGSLYLNSDMAVLIKELKPYVSEYILWKLNFYSESGSEYITTGYNLFVLRLLISSVLFYFVFKRDVKNNYYVRCYIIFASIGLFFLSNVQMYTRLSSYGLIFEILLVPLILDKVKPSSKLFVIISIFIIYGISLVKLIDTFKLNEIRFF